MSRPTVFPRGAVAAVVGVALFVVGGMLLEDSFGSDELTFLGLLCLGSGLYGIVAGAVASGVRSGRERL